MSKSKVGNENDEVQVGDHVTMWDWPEVKSLAWGKEVRAKVSGKVQAVDGKNVCLYIAEEAGKWTHLRTLPKEFLVVSKRHTRKSRAMGQLVADLADRREWERKRKLKKRRAYRGQGA